ncbi:MEKHLA domain-containing protein [Anabaena sphaerica FACHB-251]|uniref:MEKHLA domain-containing protein n=1 Tax=Anabaena sphaerica FACHB-251 TaxID=2692883 RepID=A0A926WGV0_9NOST|nr:MEKHLA domain-containing protein [Anabaena sphaerica]MBD2294331.1 MEKHLA domain-containing protein [Anabaena sphaerica FACHB-251]
MTSMIEFPWQQEAIIIHSQRILNSFQYWLGYSVLDVSGSPLEIAQALFAAPFVLASQGTEVNPILNYGNRKALAQWEMSWEEFTRTPSRNTAEAVLQPERNRLLADAATKGFSYFSGVRITSTGKRFQIEDGIVWNILNEQNQYCGQAGMFSKCEFI